MNIADFDAWRGAYDRMSYADQQLFYDRMELDHPVQAGFNVEAHVRFLNYVRERVRPVYVLELGGWKGELASAMLDRFPAIAIWCNVEICRAAVKKSVTASARYVTWIPENFVWRVSLPPSNVLVAAHFVEHIRREQLAALLHRLPPTVEYAALQAPLAEGATDWDGYHGSHILECGWAEVECMMDFNGFRPIAELRDGKGIGEFRAYER